MCVCGCVGGGFGVDSNLGGLQGILLMGYQVGLLIIQLDALVQPGGHFLHLSRWWDTHHGDPLTHPAGPERVCVYVCVSLRKRGSGSMQV